MNEGECSLQKSGVGRVLFCKRKPDFEIQAQFEPRRSRSELQWDVTNASVPRLLSVLSALRGKIDFARHQLSLPDGP